MCRRIPTFLDSGAGLPADRAYTTSRPQKEEGRPSEVLSSADLNSGEAVQRTQVPQPRGETALGGAAQAVRSTSKDFN